MSFGDLWITVPNWDEFQHYKDRSPVWIRVYVELLDRPEYVDLTPTSQALLHRIWMLYARTNGQMRVCDANVTRRGRGAHATRTRHFEALNHAGFITLSASRPAPQRQRQRQSSKAVTSMDHVANGNGPEFQIPKDLLRDVPR